MIKKKKKFTLDTLVLLFLHSLIYFEKTQNKNKKIFSHCLTHQKTKIIEKQSLPPGVTQNDVDLYKDVREKATNAVFEIMNENRVNLAAPSTSINPNLISPTSIAIAAQERCPAAIDFGTWDIETWYSSPFPQEYARSVFSFLFFPQFINFSQSKIN